MSKRSIARPPLRVAIVGGASLAAAVWAAALDGALSGRASLVARVDPNTPAGLRPRGVVPVFSTLGELISSGIEIDLILFGDWVAPQADLVRRALEQRWHVVCDGFATDIRTRMPELRRVATNERRLLITKLPKHARPVSPVTTAGTVAAEGSAMWLRWTRPAAPGTPHVFVTTPRPLVDELVPWLLTMVRPSFGAASPLQVRAELSKPSDPPQATVRVEFTSGEWVEIVIAHDRRMTGRDTAGLRVPQRYQPTFSPVDVLARWYAMQLAAAIDAIARDSAGDWAQPSEWIAAVMDAVRRSIVAGGALVDVRN